MVFSDFFDYANICGIRRPGIYSPFRDSANRQKVKFEIRKRVSFRWSNASPNMVKNNDFIYSIKRN